MDMQRHNSRKIVFATEASWLLVRLGSRGTMGQLRKQQACFKVWMMKWSHMHAQVQNEMDLDSAETSRG